MHASGMSAADGSESPALWLPSNVPRKDLLRDKIRAKLRAVDEAVLRDTAARRAARRRKANGRTAASLPASPPRQGAAASGAHPELPPGTKTGSAGAGGPVDDVDETAARYAHESATRASLAAKPGRVACPGAPVPSPEQARKAREARQLIRALRKGSERLEQRLELGILRGERR
ncbi:hypothetical protein FNF27_04843 [Cafeteria roenbergensis]|uniref:Uncharacterized protein n=1 Tax=Cafeteria roenbergensis TaxID=33653 RepID=A0A5A8E7B0_CAFRO|nr:hypothetical protein FNF27_04843 [Cafeteria roenbergensis]